MRYLQGFVRHKRAKAREVCLGVEECRPRPIFRVSRIKTGKVEDFDGSFVDAYANVSGHQRQG